MKSILMQRREKILKLKQNHETDPAKICKVLSCDISQEILTNIFKDHPELSMKEIFTRKIISDIEKRLYKLCRNAKNRGIVSVALYFSTDLSQEKAALYTKSNCTSIRNILNILNLNHLLPIMIKYKIHWLRKPKWKSYTWQPNLDVVFHKKLHYHHYNW